MSSVTPIRGGGGQPPTEPPPSPPGVEDELATLLGYVGSIQGTPLDEAIDEQRRVLWGARAVIDLAAAALEQHFGTDWPSSVPHYAMALRNASETIDNATGALEGGVLEDRALAIARAEKTAQAAP